MVQCCRSIVGLVRQVASPFSRLIATGFYDGPTNGLVECSTCKMTYSFERLDWDDQQDLRVFSLAPACPGGLDGVAQAEGAPTPKWPIWVLGDAQGGFGATVDAFVTSAAPVEFVVATHDLLGTIEIWRPVGLGEHPDWFVELGLNREGTPD
jgi:hypothetical protein